MMTIESLKFFLGLKDISASETIWIFFGLLGQLIFFTRWLIQWILSEKNSKSYIPDVFWWLSLGGGFITLIYAWHIKSFPFMLAQFIGIIVYIRNIILISKK